MIKKQCAHVLQKTIKQTIAIRIHNIIQQYNINRNAPTTKVNNDSFSGYMLSVFGYALTDFKVGMICN